MQKFSFWGKSVYAVTTLVYELQEEYIMYRTLTFFMLKGGGWGDLLRWRELNTIYIVYMGAKIFQKSRGPFKILGAVMLIWSQSRTDVPQILDTPVKNWYASASWRLCVCVCVCVCVRACVCVCVYVCVCGGAIC